MSGRAAAFVFTLLWLSAGAPRACAVCFGDPNSTQSVALKFAVFSMVGVVALVLTAITAFFVYLKKRSDRLI